LWAYVHPGILTGPDRGAHGSQCLVAARCKTRLLDKAGVLPGWLLHAVQLLVMLLIAFCWGRCHQPRTKASGWKGILLLIVSSKDCVVMQLARDHADPC
jgi:hypothetical protein